MHFSLRDPCVVLCTHALEFFFELGRVVVAVCDTEIGTLVHTTTETIVSVDIYFINGRRESG